MEDEENLGICSICGYQDLYSAVEIHYAEEHMQTSSPEPGNMSGYKVVKHLSFNVIF